jgi:hypothetical protein
MGIRFTSALVAVLSASVAAEESVTFDGVLGAGDVYTTTEQVGWYNGHKVEQSVYGDFYNQLHTTTLSYGVGELAGDSSGTEYFFLHVEVPLYAKNMIWQELDWKNQYPLTNTDPNAGLTEADVASYRAHHETHHNPGDMKLDYNGATGSEKAVFVDSSGAEVFRADLGGDADNVFGLLGYKDSVDYLFDNGLATEQLSLARGRTMSFELMFELDAIQNAALLDIVRNGVEFHLSPERGLTTVVPLPTTAAMAGLGLAGIGFRRRRPTF